MKITNVGLYSNDVEFANLSFRDPNSENPYVASYIDGLDGDDIVPKFYSRSDTTGKRWYNLTLSKRVLGINIILNPSFTDGLSYSELRDDLYRAIASCRDGVIEIKFNDGLNTIATVTGFITKFESNLMTAQPMVILTVRCDDAMLKSPIEVDATFLDSNIVVLTDTVHEFKIEDLLSTSPHGFSFAVSFAADSTFFIIRDGSISDKGYFEIIPGLIDGETGFIAGDQLVVSTVSNKREVILIRDSESIYLADKLTPGSNWPTIFPGNTYFRCSTDLGFTWDYFKYHPTYWGV